MSGDSNTQSRRRRSTVYDPALLPRVSSSVSEQLGISRHSSAATASTHVVEEATSQLLRNNSTEHRRYAAARAVRALRESSTERPATGELQLLARQAAELGRWRRRRRPALLRAIAQPHDPDLPDDLQGPVPPHSRWIMDARANVLFNAFRRASNPVEDFYLAPLDDMWRTHRYGMYGLRYPNYPNAATDVAPADGSGLYYRPNKKMLADPGRAHRVRDLGLVVTLDHIKTVASRAIGQFFPKMKERPRFFYSWHNIDTVLGACIEYFHHYFELRRVEEMLAARQCRLYSSSELDVRRRRMDECVVECGQVYSTYLLGFGTPFQHLRRGATFSSSSSMDRHVFEAFYAFVAQCVWIVYRRPNVTVIAREIGRLFRTAAFDPARRTPEQPPDRPPPPRSAESGSARRTGSRGRRSRRSGGSHRQGSDRQPTGSDRQPASTAAITISRLFSASEVKIDSKQLANTISRLDKSNHTLVTPVRPKSSSAGRHETPHFNTVADDKPSGTAHRSESNQTYEHLTQNGTSSQTLRAMAGAPQSASSSLPSRSESPPLTDSSSDTAVAANVDIRPTSSAPVTSPSSAAPSHLSDVNQHPVSMKDVYGRYTGPPPPRGAVFRHLNASTPLLQQSVASPPPPSALHPDRANIGILGTPLHLYDDVLSAIDDCREQKEARLQFLGPSSKKAGFSRVASVIPYLLLPTKNFSPDS